MATSYPSGIDNFTNPTSTDTLDSATVPHATQHANANDAIEAIEAELGTNPKGAKATVKARLDDVDTSITGKVATTTTISTTAPIAGGGDLSANRTLSLNIGSSLTTSASNLIVDSTIVPYLASANTFTTGQIINGAASGKGLVIKANATTPGNIQEWQNSAGTVLIYIDSSGFIKGSGTFGNPSTPPFDANGYFSVTQVYASVLSIRQTSTSAIGITVKPANSTHTGDNFQIQNTSSTILSGFNAAGQIYVGTTASVVGSTTTAITSAAYTSATVAVFTYGGTSLVQAGQRVTVAGVSGGTYNGTWTVSAVTSTTFTVLGSGFTNVAGTGGTFALSAVGSFVAGTAAITPLVVQGASSATANLQEWQSSTGTVLAGISSAGAIFAGATASNTRMITDGRLFVITSGASQAALIQTNTATTIGLIVKGAVSMTADLQQWQNSAGTVLTSILAAGTINFASGNTSATATAGAITAPALVTGFITMQIAGTTVKVPYYAN